MRSNMHIIIRLEIEKAKANIGQIATLIHENDADLVAIDVKKETPEKTIRDITIKVNDEPGQLKVIKALNDSDGVYVKHISDRTFLVHLGGKIDIKPKLDLKNREQLSHVYTPEVARVCNAINANPLLAYNLTIKSNSVAVVSDGTAVLGLGQISPEAAMPVMEGKAMLFKRFADINAYPICLDTTDKDEIIQTIKAISPGFGGINLEDIGSPQCFEIEETLKKELDIPVFHDDQHGTAIVVLAGILNALKLTKKSLKECKIVVCGIGAAGIAITKMLLAAGAENIIGVDKEGSITRDHQYDNKMWEWYANHTNPEKVDASLSEAMTNADIFIGVSRGDILKEEDLKNMAKDPIVFALANPIPEISPDIARDHVRVMATGRSDYPNQVNNLLCFPGIFRGALDARASSINEQMKVAAAEAIAATIGSDELSDDYIIPGVFNEKVVGRVREAVVQAAIDSGVSRKI
ncbi:NAD-dependent malic enzyme [Gracilibacillus thailandensis]|uniref:NAD-dependent malic enzyme n=1 Tax=Gracilibacillus thailandensis TaxID=563735 RepID=A0A6N7QRQ6_9BACI|nr:NAD-dependent malic enzyme [Gracilibacillus thailandensis]MRI64777.1 NAD-dependent malic enzyme [Gracilibacillus thailandensis]